MRHQDEHNRDKRRNKPRGGQMTTSKRMTKAEAVKLFRHIYKIKAIQLGYRRVDEVAKRTEWNDYTDALCKDGLITSKQYDTWDQPF